MTAPYKVPLIPQNLSKEETVVQIAEVLNYLSEVTDDVFMTVNKRLESNSTKLNQISKRIDASAAKISSLKGAKRATQVFSSSKYPAADLSTDYTSIFENSLKLEVKRHEVKHSNYSSAYEPLSKLQFYHVKVEEHKRKIKPDGLGEIPLNINCINDLLLYNTGKNLYKNFTMADSLRGSENIGRDDNYSSSEIGEAPASINQRSSMTKSSKKEYFYAPKIEELPALDVPLDLPDLPGIADDLRYQSDLGLSIAPSAFNSSVLENIPDDLPSIVDAESKMTGGDQKTSGMVHPPIQDIPKPPPIEDLPPINEALSEKLPDAEPSKEAPVAQPRRSMEEGKFEKTPHKNDLPPQTDVHSSLMEAIRQAGGTQKAKLRATEQAEEEKRSKSLEPAGDLMADLHNKLLMRRKGISGTKKQEENAAISPDSALGKISAMIPAPVPKTEGETTSTDDDEDWQ